METESTMMPMTVQEVADAVGGRLTVSAGAAADADTVVTCAVSDSRQVRPGAVFVAIAGERVDGHDFVGTAGEAGAAVALVNHEVDAPTAQIVVDGLSFDAYVTPQNYAIAFALTIVFAFITQLIMRRKISRIHMAESLKSVE